MEASESAVVVTFREMENAVKGKEAVEAVVDAAQQDSDSTEAERATAAAAVGRVLTELRRSEANVDAPVLNSPHSGTATRIQSMIAEKAGAFDPLPTGGLEAKFDTGDWIGWASVVWEKIKHIKKHELLPPPPIAPEPMPEQVRIGVLGDWGTGLYGARPCVQSLKNDPQSFDMMVHLGDVYYSGTKKEVQDRFLALWPYRNGAINRAINSNHEMYAGGYAYFDDTLPRFGQTASYFAHQNKHWTLIGLDLAYKDHDIDDAQLTWLEAVMQQVGSRKVILMSHHQLFSHFESQGTALMAKERFTRILKDPRVVVWVWGHEHLCTVFEQPHPAYGLYGRCFGHGGMPHSRSKTRDLPRAGEAIYADDHWVRSKASQHGGHLLPDCVILEGPNPYIKGEEDKFAPHGYAVLQLEGKGLLEQVLTPSGKVIYQRQLVT